MLHIDKGDHENEINRKKKKKKDSPESSDKEESNAKKQILSQVKSKEKCIEKFLQISDYVELIIKNRKRYMMKIYP